MNSGQFYKIGEIAEKTGLTLRTIRYYHELGLIQPVKRSSGNYRLYDYKSVAILKLISNLKKLDFSLDEIKEMLLNQEEDQNIYLKTINRTKKILIKEKKKVAKKLEYYQKLSDDLDVSIATIEKCVECRSKKGYEVPCEPDCQNRSVHIDI